MRIIVIIAICLVIALVFFGKNPFKEAQERNKQYGGDPLVAAISKYNANQQKPGMFGFGHFPSTGSHPANGNAAPGQGFENNIVPEQAVPSSPESYYPPTAPTNANTGQATASNAPADLSGTDMRLRSGQRIGTDGVNIYTIDASGKQVPLPDGGYTLYDGTRIDVLGGKRVAGR